MEEAVVKQGTIYLQLQQTFGKKWKRLWAVLYRDSPRSSARLELLEGPERPRRAEGGRRLVRLSDCVHVAEAGPEATACPKDTVPFLLETTDRRFLLAADAEEVAEWIRQLCELAFPRSQEEAGAAKDTPQGTEGELSMEENSLYSSRRRASLDQDFEVTVRVTASAQRCHLRGRCVLRVAPGALELRHPQSRDLLLLWPYRFLRRFGRDKVTFSFEAGRRCASGEGNFEFDTRQGNEIFQAIEAAIEAQRSSPGWAQPHEDPKCPSGEAKALKTKPGEPSGSPRGVDFPYAEPRDSLRRGMAGAESEYAVPFDTIAKSLLSRQLGCPQEVVPEPLSVPRDAGGAQQPPGHPTAPKPPEHIYDEPEGLSGPSGLSGMSLYDEPQEVKGEAWRLQAAPEEPPGLGCPYNPQRDDYAVPKGPFLLPGKEWLSHCDYDNVALRVAKRRDLQ